jgi:cell wall-associated NlpC family hydrolase
MPSTLDKSIWGNTNSPYIIPQGQATTPGQTFVKNYLQRKSGSAQVDAKQRIANTQDTAIQVADKSAGNIPLDKYGIVKDTQAPKPMDLTDTFNKSNSSITKTGTLAADTEEAKSQWQTLKRAQDLGASYTVNGTLGLATGVTNSQSKGGQAVALAMQAFTNKTPYSWGGNSLTKGVDCSGLVQQVYSQLGIKLPRTTYEQAKSGSIINLNSLQPGDLVFYNTGSSDPNGVGQYSHVAIYTGNGQIVDARNTKSGIKTGSIYDAGTPVLGVRPW